MGGYTKLFSSILESTVWLESPPIKVVWIAMLAMADRDGIVEASVPGLAKRAGVERGYCEQALAIFLAPDPDSRTPDFEGRRIEPVPGGWRLLNYEVHRQRASKEEAKEKAAARQRRHRERNKALRGVTAVTNVTNNAIAPSPPPSSPPLEEERTPLTPTIERRSPIQSRRRKDAAWEGPRLYVPQRCHNDFVALRQGAESELLAWYRAVSDEWTDGARQHEEPGADMFTFWKARYAEKWPTAAPVKGRPPWAV
jgi:hypothetical protein